MRKHRILRGFLTIILVALLIAIAVSIALVGTGRMGKILEKRGITILSREEPAEPAEEQIWLTDTLDGEGTADTAEAPAEAAPGTETPAGTVPGAEAPAETPEGEPAAAGDTAEAAAVPMLKIGDKDVASGVLFEPNAATVSIPDTELTSTNCVLVKLTDDTIVAQQNADVRVSPASMTKIVTVMVAGDMLDPDSTVLITDEMIDYCRTNDLSAAGLEAGQTYTVRELMYGTILPSGGEAAAALAITAGGSLDGFTALMNQKAADLGLADQAHFTNCAGTYAEDHYCTLLGMAGFLKAALLNDTVREVLSTKVYTIPAKVEGKEDLVLSNWFLRRIEDRDCGGEVIAAKTGFVTQSGNCAASYEVSASGVPYICVTANSDSEWNCIYDHVALYKKYAA